MGGGDLISICVKCNRVGRLISTNMYLLVSWFIHTAIPGKKGVSTSNLSSQCIIFVMHSKSCADSLGRRTVQATDDL